MILEQLRGKIMTLSGLAAIRAVFEMSSRVLARGGQRMMGSGTLAAATNQLNTL
jgi:hypothetical protein